MKRDMHIWAPVMREGTQGMHLARGILRHAMVDSAWRVNITSTGLPSFLARTILSHPPDGIVGCICSTELRRFVRRLGVPVVDLSTIFTGEAWPRAGVDDRAAGAMAAAYMMGLGVRHTAATGPARFAFSETRIAGFTAALSDGGIACSTHSCSSLGAWMTSPDRRKFRAWLKVLPKPCGLFATTDVVAADCLRECGEAGIGVPNEIALLAAGNDELVCAACRPTLSSIAIPWDEMGYQAARLLAARLQGEEPVPRTVLVRPSKVEERQSTDVASTADGLVRRAVAVIRQEAAGSLNVEALTRRLHIGRRTLERRFRAALGMTMAEEIGRVRIEHARRLLAETDLPVKLVAASSGFLHVCHFTRTFKRATGESPSGWRTRGRGLSGRATRGRS